MIKVEKYLYITILFLILIMFGSILDTYVGKINTYSLIIKLFIILICIVIIRKRKINCIKGKFLTRYLFIAFIPMVISTLLIYGPINKSVSIWTALLGFLGSIFTAIWEELHYRAIGVNVFKGGNDKLNKNSAILLVLLFGFSHAINIVLKPSEYLIELFRIIFSASCGSLFLALYLKTENIYVSMISHFLLNYTTLFFKTFSYSPNYFGYIAYDIIFYFGIVTYFAVAIRIFKHLYFLFV